MSVVVKRETDKELRAKQNGHIKELSPLLTTCHLPSIKIFFPTVQLEEFSPDGQVIGEIDQGDSSDEEGGQEENGNDQDEAFNNDDNKDDEKMKD